MSQRPDLDSSRVAPSAIRRVNASTPVDMAASVFVTTSLVQCPCELPIIGPGLRLVGPPTLGVDSHRDPPSGLCTNTQHLGCVSWTPNRAKKPNPVVAAMSSPTSAVGAPVASFRSAAVRLLTAANQITKVAGSSATVTSENDEKLAANDSTPTASSRPPRTPGAWTLAAMKASRYGDMYASRNAKSPASWLTTSGSPVAKNRKDPSTTAPSSPTAAPTVAARLPRPGSVIASSLPRSVDAIRGHESYLIATGRYRHEARCWSRLVRRPEVLSPHASRRRRRAT